MDRILDIGIVEEVLKGGSFTVRLLDHEEHKVLCHICGKMRIARITICVDDEVGIELSPYDLHRGRIIWRY